MELKRYLPLIILAILTCFIIKQVEAQKVQKVVIDAGHGGHDPGAVGKFSKEKDITLSLALKTGQFIHDNLPGVQVIYTRNTDEFVELYRRARIANEKKADLFISIHCNASKSTSPYGSETYVMGLHKSEANLSVAQIENASILLEEDYHVQYDGFNPSSPEGYIFFSMLQNAYMDQSLGLASRMQYHFKAKANLFDRGVKQAGFLVLYKTTMPSVLIEVGFISNAKEEKFLASDEGQNQIASAIFRAVRDYKGSIEKTKIPIEEKTSSPDLASINSIRTGSPAPDNLEKPSDNQIVFKVQFLISNIKKDTSRAEFKGLHNISYYYHNGHYKYTYGNVSTIESANTLMKELNAKGFKDCFVVAFLNNERIDIDKAKSLLKN